MSLLATTPLDYMGYSLKWSPFDRTLIAVATAQNFGIIGAGRLALLNYQGGSNVSTAGVLDTTDGLYDCCWNESNGAHICIASGDGSVRLWDWKAKKVLREWREHSAEVYAVDWNMVEKERILSGAWDNTIKCWHPDERSSISTYTGHTRCIYSVQWHPHNSTMFASCSGDGTAKLWDVHNKTPILNINAHGYEVLSCDWNKYDENILVTSSVDKSIRIWDIRKIGNDSSSSTPSSSSSTATSASSPLHTPIAQLEGHQFAVRRVRCSPHHPSQIASASYDMSTCVWDFTKEDALLCRMDDHTEFVLGVEWSNWEDGIIATASWDESVHIYRLPLETEPPQKR